MNKLKIIFLVLLFAGCREKYDITLRPSDISLLVVEGVLNAGQGPTTISLSKSTKVNDRVTSRPVLQAKVTVEGKNGELFNLPEAGNGNYANAQLNLVMGREYRLRIITSDNKEYLSEYVVAKQSPPIDSITWKKENGNVIIYANTHDPANNTRYYKWDYDETWEIRSFYTADYKFTGTTIEHSPMYNYRCWKYSKSSTINIGTTAQLQSDVLRESPIQTIIGGSEKLSVRYSVLVKQQSLTKDAYEYFKLMKRNTESLGSIFDPQPSELRGNVKCISNPDEGVIGYITASNFTEKRIFITSNEVDWRFLQNCPYEKIKNHPDSLRGWLPSYLPWGAEEIDPGVPLYYFLAPATCVDCTKRGGDLAMPSYW